MVFHPPACMMAMWSRPAIIISWAAPTRIDCPDMLVASLCSWSARIAARFTNRRRAEVESGFPDNLRVCSPWNRGPLMMPLAFNHSFSTARVRSTGPRTAEGKARVAGNARKHGATAKPDPQRVAIWLAIILDRADIAGKDFTPIDDRGYRALALAQAEAQLNAAEKAVCELKRPNVNTPPHEDLGLDDFAAIVRDLDPGAVGQYGQDQTAFQSASAVRLREPAEEGGAHQRRLMRYLAEARSKRRKAFAAWIEVRHAGPRSA